MRASFWATSDSYPCFGVDSNPWVGESVGGSDGAIWDDWSLWTCPFPFGDAPFLHLLSPSLPTFRHSKATRCIYVYCETGSQAGYMVIHATCPLRSITFLPLVSSDLFCYLL